MTPLDIAALRAEFPALSVELDGRPLAYFDGPGGTQVPQRVIDAVVGYYLDSNANDGGAFLTSERSDAVVRAAYEALADFLGATSSDEIKFGANMTSLTMHISRSIGATLKAGDDVIVTTLDHEANVGPWRAMAADRGLTVRTVDIRPDDVTLDLADLERQLSSRTKLVAVGYASNAVGTINPVAEIIERAHAVGALTYLDAVHYAPHGLIDVVGLGTDFLACSTYKFFGPHQGVLYGRAEVLERLPSYKIRPAHDRVETGTQSFESIAGAGAAIDYLASVGERFGEAPVPAPGESLRRAQLRAGMAMLRGHEMELFGRLLDGLEQIAGLRTWGITDRARFGERTPTLAVTLEQVEPRAAAEALGRRGITTWDGNFYAQGLVERLGLAESGGVLRLGIAHYNTVEEVDRLVEALTAIAAGPGRSTQS